MADSIRMKQMEIQLQQVIVTMLEVQQEVGAMEDTIEIMVDKKLEDVANRSRGDMCNQIREEMWEHNNMVRDQMQQLMLMFLN